MRKDGQRQERQARGNLGQIKAWRLRETCETHRRLGCGCWPSRHLRSHGVPRGSRKEAGVSSGSGRGIWWSPPYCLQERVLVVACGHLGLLVALLLSV